MWQNLGTDCGICLSACPFSQEVDAMKDVITYKNKKEVIEKCVVESKGKYKTRSFIKEPPEWLT